MSGKYATPTQRTQILTTAVEAILEGNDVSRVELTDRRIYSTTNYSLFKFHNFNRPANEKHICDLVKAIEKKNRLADYPISVSEDFEVLDGQHRLLAAQRLGVRIYYAIAIATQIEDVKELNSIKKSWTTRDQLHVFCQMGNTNYIQLQQFMDRWPHIPLRVAINITQNKMGAANNLVSGAFDRGDYVCSDLPFAEEVAGKSYDFSKWIKFYKHQSFIFAIARCIRNPNYDHKQMMRKMELLSMRLVHCGRTAEYLELLEEIYNNKIHTDNRVWLTK